MKAGKTNVIVGLGVMVAVACGTVSGCGAPSVEENARYRVLVRGTVEKDPAASATLAQEAGEIRVALVEAAPEPEIVEPYHTNNIISTFGDCRPGGRQHSALDFADSDEYGGLGKPIVAMTRSRVEFIGSPEEDARNFGKRDRRSGFADRRGRRYPRSKEIEGYGTVYFFTRTAGRWRTGEIIVTRGIGGKLDNHTIRYMHLGAVHPDLEVGDIVEAGQEIALMGGTGVQGAVPHLHLDIEDPDEKRVDVAPLLGLEPDPERCR